MYLSRTSVLSKIGEAFTSCWHYQEERSGRKVSQPATLVLGLVMLVALSSLPAYYCKPSNCYSTKRRRVGCLSHQTAHDERSNTEDQGLKSRRASESGGGSRATGDYTDLVIFGLGR